MNGNYPKAEQWESAAFDPEETAARALRSESDLRMVIANLRYLFRHHDRGPELIEETGAQLCALSGTRELRRIAEAAEESETDRLGNAVCYRLLSGYWRTASGPAGQSPGAK